MPQNASSRRRLRTLRSPATLAAGALATVSVVVAVATVGPEAAARSEGRVATARSGVVQQTVSGTGNLAAANEVDLGFATSGTVEEVNVRVGEHVQAGQLIGRLDDARQEVAVAQARAALTSARSALDDAEDDTSASTTDESSTSTGSGGTTSVASATAAVASAKLDLEDAEAALEDTRLRAPTTGTITALDGAVGQTVSGSGSSTATSSTADTSSSGTDDATGGSSSSGSASSSSSSGFATLSQLSRLDLEVSFSESDIADLKVGQAASVTVTALDDVTLAAKVTDIGTTATSTSGVVSYPVTLAVTQKATGVLPGMSASAEVVTAQAKGISVPSQAISGRSVTVRRNGKDVETAVTTGVVGDSTTQVTSGLEAGDQVVLPALAATSSSSGSTGSGSASGALGGAGGVGGAAGAGGGPGGAGGGGTGGPPAGGR